MPDAIYAAYTGAIANLEDLEVIANNVANVGTSGFRRHQTNFESVYGPILSFVRVSGSRIDLSPGARKATNDPLHGAIEGDGLFVITGSDGTELYTRRGDFRVDAQGQLVLPNGLAVQGEGGALVVPPGSRAELTADGTVLTEAGPIGRLKQVRFADGSELEKVGNSLLAAAPGAAPEDVSDPKIAVGFVEGSNVNLAAEMVGLIQATRAFEAAMRTVLINDELTASLIQRMMA
ncbi:MAG: flagellar hook basal-body protein [Myxococcota bacterium]